MGDGKVSAIPDELYTYSNTIAPQAVNLQSWIRTVLTPALQDYQRTAVDFGRGIPGVTSGPFLDAAVTGKLGETWHLDAWVRTVGFLFHEAGSARHEGDNQVVKLTDAQLAALATKYGADLAKKFDPNNPDKFFDSISPNLDDPQVMAGLVAALNGDQIQALGMRQRGIEAMVAALAGGSLDPVTLKRVVETLAAGHGTAQSPQIQQWTAAMLAAIAANPSAARVFGTELVNDKLALRLFTYQAQPGNQTTEQVDAVDKKTWQSFFTILDETQQPLSGDDLKTFLITLGNNLPTMSLDQYRMFRPQFEKLIQDSVSHLLPNLRDYLHPGYRTGQDNPQELTDWEVDALDALKSLDPLENWAQRVYGAHAANDTTMRAFIENAGIAAVMTALPDALTGGLAAPFAGALSGEVQTLVDKALNIHEPGGDLKVNLQGVVNSAGVLATITQLFGNGTGRYHDGGSRSPVSLKEVLGSQYLPPLLEAALIGKLPSYLRDRHSEDDWVNWARNLEVQLPDGNIQPLAGILLGVRDHSG